MKLKQMNDKLAKELKILSTNLDKSLDKNRVKGKASNPYTDANIKGSVYCWNFQIAREKELETAQKQIKNYQKEISGLKVKLEAKTGYEKYFILALINIE